MLQQHLQWNVARLAFVSTFLIALMRVKTVNLAEIATGFSGKAKVESHYKRLQRFFRNFEVDYESIALTVARVMNIPEPWVISIDRTDWQFDKTVFNVLLTLGAIETLFGCFKTRGFCLESTHLQDSQRLSKLIALLTLALCWAFSSGLWLSQLNPLNLKKHGRLPKSIFRIGFDFLRHIIFDLHLNSQAFFNSIKFLSCTYDEQTFVTPIAFTHPQDHRSIDSRSQFQP